MKIKKAGKEIHQMRKAAGLKQAELAKKAGIDQSNLSKIELGSKLYSVDFVNIMESLGYTVILVKGK